MGFLSIISGGKASGGGSGGGGNRAPAQNTDDDARDAALRDLAREDDADDMRQATADAFRPMPLQSYPMPGQTPAPPADDPQSHDVRDATRSMFRPMPVRRY